MQDEAAMIFAFAAAGLAVAELGTPGQDQQIIIELAGFARLLREYRKRKYHADDC
jgi:hypothetical protein